MAQAITFGSVTLRNDLSLDQEDVKIEPQWTADIPRGLAIAAATHKLKRVSFNLLARFTTDALREAYKLTLWTQLHPAGDMITPRSLTWTNPTTDAGLSIAEPPEVVEEGRDDTGYILVLRYKFICGYTAPSTNSVVFGDLILDGNIAYHIREWKVEHAWQNVIEPAFRSRAPFGQGNGNFSTRLSFVMQSRFASQSVRENWKIQLANQLYPGQSGTWQYIPRTLYVIFPEWGGSLPITAGQALAEPPEFLGDGYDGTWYLLETRLKFIAGLLPQPDLVRAASG